MRNRSPYVQSYRRAAESPQRAKNAAHFDIAGRTRTDTIGRCDSMSTQAAAFPSRSKSKHIEREKHTHVTQSRSKAKQGAQAPHRTCGTKSAFGAQKSIRGTNVAQKSKSNSPQAFCLLCFLKIRSYPAWVTKHVLA